METTIVPLVLQDRLGLDGTLGFLEFTQANNTALRDDVLEVVTDRFERRLGVDVASLREQMAADRLATANEFAAVRQEVANVRKDMSDGRVELIKWSFLFWIGQIAVMSGVMALLLKSTSLR